ncbi:MAG TPA: TonB-dependent receptor, partial [Candidatus Binatus sp.]|nr:TonB-dependent receptor [Candidatus Binatus sp.]
MSRLSRIAGTAAVLTAAAIVIAGSVGFAGTTGRIRGRIFDAQSKAPIAGAEVTAVSPSQTAKTTTLSTGGYAFVSLAPDTYAITVVKAGYNTTTKPGVTVLADQEQDVDIDMQRSVATLGTVTVRATSDLLKPGTTSDVYSISPTGSKAAQALSGPGGLNSAYSAMASVPGINVPQGQMGWYQPVYVRGGDLDQAGWELDGIPANRSYDNAPMTMVSNIGQQELQVYTGGTQATADASGIAGYVNQVIKRGTAQPFANIVLGIGTPALYNKVSAELGGQAGRLSYYGGFAGINTTYRYINNANGAGAAGYFYPINVPSGPAGIFVGGTATFAPGQSYAIQRTSDTESVANFHYSIPHGGLNDDVQFLYLWSNILAYYYSTINDLGGTIPVATTNGGVPIPWSDGTVYKGPVFQPVSHQIGLYPTYFFPSSPPHQAFSPLPNTIPDGNSNAVGITKLQYQRNFDTRSYLRVFGYSLYSFWSINGPVSAFLPFGAEVADYELPVHQYGFSASYTNQLSDQHLLTASAYWSFAGVQRYSTTGGFPGGSPYKGFTNLIDSAGNCYDSTGSITSCFGNTANRGYPLSPAPGAPNNPTPFVAPPGSPAALAGAQWIATENGYRANLNQVRPENTAVAVNDNWRANDKLLLSIGLRIENYRFFLPDTADGYPARAFWFAAYNREFCIVPGVFAPEQKASPSDTCVGDFGAGAVPVNIVNTSGGQLDHDVWQPRVGITYTVGPNDVLRGSWGIYSRPPDSRDAAYNTVQQDLATFVGTNLVPYGFNSPQHDIKPDTSSNADVSWEHHFNNSDTSFKLTPFYRSTQNQLQQFILNPLTGLFGTLNTGTQTSSGVEFALTKGNFNANGWAAQLAYTFTH